MKKKIKLTRFQGVLSDHLGNPWPNLNLHVVYKKKIYIVTSLYE